MPYISVIVTTYRDWNLVEQCIQALTVQTIKDNSYEVIIANNDPSCAMPSKMILPDNFKIIEEAKPGSYAARNTALKISLGEIIAFTDSDCIPEPDWLENAVKQLVNGADRVGGKISLLFRSKKLTYSEIYEKAFSFRQKDNVARGFSVTANLITWRQTIEEVGLFNEILLSGGDVEWNMRATELGKSIVFGHDCTVFHPARFRLEQLVAKRRRVTGGIYQSHGLRFADVIKGLMPPIKTLPILYNDENLCAREIFIAFFVRYYLDFLKLFFLLRLRGGLDKPIRL